MARKRSKLPELLELLDWRDRNALLKYVASPFFNESPLLSDLLQLHLSGETNPEKIWLVLFPEQPYKDLKLRHLRSELLRLVEGFLSIREIKKRPSLMQTHLLAALRKKKANDLYEFNWRKIMRRQDKSGMGSEFYLERYLVQSERNTFLEHRSQRSGVNHLQATVDGLDTFYLFSKLKYSCTILNNRKVVDVDYENLLLEEILSHLRKRSYDHIPGIAIYFRIYEMLTEPDQDYHFSQLKGLFSSHINTFSKSEARDMFAFALNHCIGRINKGESDYLGEILDLYQQGLDQEILLEGGQISPWDYKNIVVVGLRREEFTWTEQFIRTYKDKIPEAFRDNAYTYNLAKFYFYKHEYSQVLKLLQQVEYEDVFYNLDSKVMLLKVYYEMDETEALDSLIDSFRTFLGRNKLISAHHRRNYLNLIRFVKKLSRLYQHDLKKLDQLREEIEATEQVADIDWLRVKLNGKA